MNLRRTTALVASAGILLSVCTALARAGTYSDAVNALSPDHYYRLNETVADTLSATVLDTGTATAINGTHEGTWTGPPDAQVNVPGPNLPGFDSGNGAILLNDAGAINLGDGAPFAASTMTVALWFNNADPTFDGIYADRMFQNNQSNANGGFSISIWDNEDDEDNGVVLSVASTTRILKSSDLDIQDGNWHNLVAVRNGGDPADVQMFVDGVDRTDLLVPTEGFGNTGTTTWIGARDFPGDVGRYSDRLDEVAIWLDRALTVQEAQRLYAAAVPEPSALTLLGLGLASLIAARRRRSN